MKPLRATAAALTVATLLAGCSQPSENDRYACTMYQTAHNMVATFFADFLVKQNGKTKWGDADEFARITQSQAETFSAAAKRADSEALAAALEKAATLSRNAFGTFSIAPDIKAMLDHQETVKEVCESVGAPVILEDYGV